MGGPVRIPKVYNGHNRTFFFFNFEDYRNHGSSNGTFATLPTDAMRNGDFGALLMVTNPFPGNIIPKNRFDPVAVKVQSLIPTTTKNNLVTNWNQNAISGKFQYIPAVKIDHSISDRSKLAFTGPRRTRSSSAMRTDCRPRSPPYATSAFIRTPSA